MVGFTIKCFRRLLTGFRLIRQLSRSTNKLQKLVGKLLLAVRNLNSRVSSLEGSIKNSGNSALIQSNLKLTSEVATLKAKLDELERKVNRIKP